MSGKILIVDDEMFILQEIVETLTDEGFECITANDVDAALSVLSEDEGISLVLTDLKMPRKSGWDLIETVNREYVRSIDFVVMSGHGGQDLSEYEEPQFSYPFLRKPVDIDELIKAVRCTFENQIK